MSTPVKSVGRPSGREYPIVKQVRLGTEDAAGLAALSRVWRCSEAAAIRRAIHEKAEEARATRVAQRKAQGVALAEGALLAKEYYADDPDARDWAEFLGDQPSYDQG